jgi:uncharacterized protein YbjT (DUF2867 family)
MILVTGATGVNGSELVRRLSARGIPVRALARSAAKAAALSGLPGVDLAFGDMGRPETLEAALHGIDRAVLISSAAPDMVEVQSSFIAAAVRAGVRHVVKLSGIMPTSPRHFDLHACMARSSSGWKSQGLRSPICGPVSS